MKKVTLISFYPGFFGLNLRIIGACLEAADFEVAYLHLGYSNSAPGQRFPSLAGGIDTDRMTETILPEIEGSLYIGISLTASEFNAAKALTISLKKKTDIPIVWGGPHPTASLEQSVPFTDYVCVGEGEKLAVEFAKKRFRNEAVEDLNNLAYLRNGQLQSNPLNPIIADLNSLPIPTTNIFSQKVYFDGELHTISPEILLALDTTYIRPVPDKAVYITTLSRGCPFKCSYCNNSYLSRIYKGQKYFRYRSLDHLFTEIKTAIKNIKVLGAIFLADDNLTTLPIEVLREFARRWKDEIGLPFGTSGSPITLREDKIEILAETRLLYKFGVGIESGSENILKNIYQRNESAQQAANAISMVEKFRPLFFQKYTRPVINYQFIFDNPYENNQDVSKTLRFIAKNISQPYTVTAFSLVMYPGSDIYHRAIRDQLIGIEQEIYTETYGALKPTFTKLWLKLYRKNFPRFILFFLAGSFWYKLFNLYPFRLLYKRI